MTEAVLGHTGSKNECQAWMPMAVSGVAMSVWVESPSPVTGNFDGGREKYLLVIISSSVLKI